MRGNVYLTHSFISISSHDIFLEYSILHEENKSCVVFKHTREFTKPRRQQQRERHQTKGLVNRTMAVHVCYEKLLRDLEHSRIYANLV